MVIKVLLNITSALIFAICASFAVDLLNAPSWISIFQGVLLIFLGVYQFILVERLINSITRFFARRKREKRAKEFFDE